MKHLTVARVSVGIAVAIAVLRLLTLPPIELLDLKALDYRHVVRGPLPAAGVAVVVAVDEASLAEVGRWPWPRSKMATLVERLTHAGAAVVGFDMVFDQPDLGLDLATLRSAVAAAPGRPAGELLASLGTTLDNDARLAQALRASGRVLLGGFFEFGGTPDPALAAEAASLPEISVRTISDAGHTLPRGLRQATRAHVSIPALTTAAAGGGHYNFFPDSDGLYRRVPVAVRAGERLVPSLAVDAVRRYLGGAGAVMTLAPDGVREVRVGRYLLPVDSAGQLYVNYLGPPQTIRHVSAADVLAGRAATEALAGRIALIGFTAAGYDEIPTPFAPVASGVELQATVVENILNDASLRRPWWLVPAEAALVLLLGLLLGVVLQRRRAGGGTVLAVLLALAYAWGTQRLFAASGIALSAVYPLGAIVFCTLGGAVFRSIAEEREKRNLRVAFGQYVNEEVTELIVREPARLRLGGERREVTVLFSDIRNFTTIAEQLEADVLGLLLNEYLGEMTEVVFRHRGLLDKYMGDAVMAFWGAPIEARDNAARCCRAALDMLVALAAQSARRRAVGAPAWEIGIGISSGQAAVGNFGSARRFSYTAVGDTVNLASRLEGLNRNYGTRILVSEHTRETLGDEFVCREIDRVTVKGRVQALKILELLGERAKDENGNLRRRAHDFEEALAAYRRGAWAEAIDRLTRLVEEFPDDGAAARLLARCVEEAAVRGTSGGPA
jgi:adenylate cyclase